MIQIYYKYKYTENWAMLACKMMISLKITEVNVTLKIYLILTKELHIPYMSLFQQNLRSIPKY